MVLVIALNAYSLYNFSRQVNHVFRSRMDLPEDVREKFLNIRMENKTTNKKRILLCFSLIICFFLNCIVYVYYILVTGSITPRTKYPDTLERTIHTTYVPYLDGAD
eukprot:UN26133